VQRDRVALMLAQRALTVCACIVTATIAALLTGTAAESAPMIAIGAAIAWAIALHED
jgi:hypothetical protein